MPFAGKGPQWLMCSARWRTFQAFSLLSIFDNLAWRLGRFNFLLQDGARSVSSSRLYSPVWMRRASSAGNLFTSFDPLPRSK
jgi:hypothetical protein